MHISDDRINDGRVSCADVLITRHEDGVEVIEGHGDVAFLEAAHTHGGVGWVGEACCEEGGEGRGGVFDDLELGELLRVEVVEHLVEWGVRVCLAEAVVDVCEEGGSDVDPVVAVWDGIDIVTESVGQVFMDSLECMVICGTDVGRREVTRDYRARGNWVDSSDGVLNGGNSETRGNGHGGVGRVGDVSRWVYGDQRTRRVDVGVGVGGVGIHGIRRGLDVEASGKT